MQEITGEHPKDITALLQALVRDGLLIQKNQRRWASFRVAGDSPHSETMEAGYSPHKEGDSPHNAGSPARLPPELLALAEPARLRSRLSPAAMENLILGLCRGRWLTAKELAELLNRDADNLQTRILTGMVKKQALELRYPEVRNRPDQAYRTLSS